MLILVLGLHKGEILGLTWELVDLDAAELYIGEQVQRVGGQLLRREVKTETSEASLPLSFAARSLVPFAPADWRCPAAAERQRVAAEAPCSAARAARRAALNLYRKLFHPVVVGCCRAPN